MIFSKIVSLWNDLICSSMHEHLLDSFNPGAPETNFIPLSMISHQGKTMLQYRRTIKVPPVYLCNMLKGLMAEASFTQKQLYKYSFFYRNVLSPLDLQASGNIRGAILPHKLTAYVCF